MGSLWFCWPWCEDCLINGECFGNPAGGDINIFRQSLTVLSRKVASAEKKSD